MTDFQAFKAMVAAVTKATRTSQQHVSELAQQPKLVAPIQRPTK